MNREITMFFSNEGTQNEVRKRVVLKFMDEIKGLGKKDLASNYTYYVENLKSGDKIYLQRPAWNYYGFDFIVHVEGHVFSNGKTNPKHIDIINDLIVKKNKDINEYGVLKEKIEEVFNCIEIDDNINSSFHFNIGYEIDMILKTLKWLFIEQDIRFWNYSGRDMLIKEIRAI